jgi:DNA helicase HerA-like ATPase
MAKEQPVGNIVGESFTQEFRMAMRHKAVVEQDIVAVDATMEENDGKVEDIRVWAKIRKIERVNPLFPAEAGHELADNRESAPDTILSLSREMVTAVCQVLGYESLDNKDGKLKDLRYPPKPAKEVYLPETKDLKRIVLGDLRSERGLNLATMSSRKDIHVMVDGHSIVTRHLAILAMTGAGKSWTARRIIEEVAKKHYPIVIFDPHGDYTLLGEIDSLKDKVDRYYAEFPVFDEDAETVEKIVETLGYELSDTMKALFPSVFSATKKILGSPIKGAESLRKILQKPDIFKNGIKENLWAIFYVARAAIAVNGDGGDSDESVKEWFLKFFEEPIIRKDFPTYNAIAKRVRIAAIKLNSMSRINREMASKGAGAQPLPKEKTKLAKYDRISVVSLAGYTGDFQATMYSIIADDLLQARVRRAENVPSVFLVLEEAHNFAPARAMTDAEKHSIETTRRIAQEGRKFGVGMMLISQRPSRLDETALSQCNSQIIMRLINPADQLFVRKTVESLSEDDLRILPAMDVGEAILSGQLTNFTVLAKIKKPESQGEREEEDAFVALERWKLSQG